MPGTNPHQYENEIMEAAFVDAWRRVAKDSDEETYHVSETRQYFVAQGIDERRVAGATARALGKFLDELRNGKDGTHG